MLELEHSLGLPHHASPVAGTHNSASGSIAGRLVTVAVGVEGLMNLEVGLHFDHALLMHRRDVACGAFAPALSEESKRPTPTGLADFDAWFYTAGAAPKVLHGLQHNDELRALMSHVVGTMGAQIHAGAIHLDRPPVGSGQELLAALEPMLELSMWLADPASGAPQIGQAIRSGTLRMAASTSARGPQRGQTLQHLLGMLEGGQSYYDSNEDRAEWRGTLNGMRTRVVVDGANSIEIHMKIDNPRAHFNLTYDEASVPTAGVPSEPNRVFVSRGIFFGQQATPEEQMAALQTMPAEMAEHLFQAMQRDGMIRLWFDPEELAIHYRDSLDEQLDPLGKIWRGVQLLAWAAPQIGTAAPPPVQARRMGCSFCSTIFIYGQRTECPNCGAQATG